MAKKKDQIVEQDGNYFKKNSNGAYEPLPKVVEQDGNRFEFDSSIGDYKISQATPAKPLSFAENPLDATIEVGKQIGGKALDGLAYVGEKIDRVTGAPTRSAILAGMKGENPLSAFAGQFGRNTETAPTGKDIAILGGLSPNETIEIPEINNDILGAIGSRILRKYVGKVSPAGIAGLGIDVLADPTNIIAPEKILTKFGSMTGKTLSKGGQIVAKMGAKAADLAVPGELGSKALNLATQSADVLESATRGVAEGIQQFGNSKIDQGYNKALKTITENGLPLDKMPIEFKYGNSDAISRLSKKIRETPTGAQELKDYYEFAEAVGNKIDEKILNFSGGALPKNTAEAGEALVAGYEKGVKEFFDQIDVTYKTPAIMLESMAPEKIFDLSKKAGDDMSKYITNFVEAENNKAIGSLDPNVRAMSKENAKIGELLNLRIHSSYNDAVDGLRELGQIAFSATSQASDAVSYNKKGLRDLYFKLSDELVNTVRRTVGTDIADKLVENNKKIHEFLKEKALVADVIENDKLAPEKIFNRLIQNGDSKRIKVLASMLPDETMAQMRGAFLENLVSRRLDDKVPLASLKKALENKDSIASILFEPDELEKFKDLIDLGNGLGDAVMSKSGTGASIAFENLPKSIGQGLIDRSVREQLIKRAEGAAPAAQAIGPATQIATPAAGKQAGKTSLTRFTQRGPRESLLKASQTLSTQKQNENTNSDAISRRLRGR